MHIRSAISVHNKSNGYELYPFGPTTCMNEKMFMVWKRDRTMLEITLPSLVS
jgi:hypothetical protein